MEHRAESVQCRLQAVRGPETDGFNRKSKKSHPASDRVEAEFPGRCGYAEKMPLTDLKTVVRKDLWVRVPRPPLK
jgi:hypothetical protein